MTSQMNEVFGIRKDTYGVHGCRPRGSSDQAGNSTSAPGRYQAGKTDFAPRYGQYRH